MFRFGRTAANRLLRRTPSTIHNRLNKSQRLILDKLEERTVPATYTVMNATDGAADSLRDILAGGKGALADGDIIDFDTTFFASSQTISLTTGQLPAISKNITIQPTGAAVGNVTIAGSATAGATNRIFQITGGSNVVLAGMTLTGGNLTTGNNGGAITMAAATVTLNNMTITGNKTAGSGGAIAMATTLGSLTINNSTLSNNSAGATGGAIFTATTTNMVLAANTTTFSGNSAASGGGGAIFASSSIKLNTDSATFTQNTAVGASGTGGAIALAGTSTVTFNASSMTLNSAGSNGGALRVASFTTTTVTFTSSTVSNNRSNAQGGALRYDGSGILNITGSTMSGNTAVSVGGVFYLNNGGVATIASSTFSSNSSSGGGALRFFGVTSPGTHSITGSTISNNTTSGVGGAIGVHSSAKLSVTGTSITGNTAGGSAGAFYLSSNGTVTLDASSVTANSGSTGGAFNAVSSASVSINASTIANNIARIANGGAFNFSSTGATLLVTRSTVSGNSAATTGGAIQLASTSSSVTLTNSTVVGNTAGTNGGAIALNSTTWAGLLNVRNSTIYSNVALGVAGAGGLQTASTVGTITFDSSVLAGNFGIYRDMRNTNASSRAINGDNNIFGAIDLSNYTYAGGANQTGSEAAPFSPGLFPLANNGGTMQTSAMHYNSPAINKGNNVSGTLVDQLNNARPGLGSDYDVGALEGVFGVNPFFDSVSGLTNVTTGSPATYTFSVVYDDETGISTPSLDGTEIKIANGSIVITPSLTGTSSAGGNKIKADYSFTAPGGTWDFFDAGTYVITTVAGTINDTDGVTHTNFAEGVGFFLASFTGPVSMTVSEATDVVDGNYGAGKLSFREALSLANSTLGGTDTILFDNTVFNTNKTIDISTLGQFNITESVAITGPTAGVTFDAKNKATTRHFNITDGTAATITVSMSNMTLTGGNHATGAAMFINDEAVTIDGFTITGNSAGPAIYLDGVNGALTFKNGQINNTKGVTAAGAAIRVNASTSTASVTIDNSSFTGNTTTSNGGVLYTNFGGVVAITNSTMYDNRAADGGALAFWGGTSTTNATITNSTIYGNTATTNGGGIALRSTSNNLILNNSTIARNSAGSNGGGIAVNNVTNSVTINSTIVAENLRGSTSVTHDIFSNGITISGDYNLVRIADGISFSGSFNKTGTLATPQEAGFAKFGYQGGASYMNVLPLAGGSAAIDAGNSAYGAGSFDQRGTGFNRTVDDGGYSNIGDATDMGAYEGFLNIPLATLLSAPNFTTAALTHQIQVVYTSFNTFNASTFGTDDVTVTVPVLGALTTSGFSVAGSGTSFTITYTLDTSGVTAAHNGQATVSINAAAVTDNAALNVAAGPLGNFTVGLGAVYLVNATTDTNTGVGLVGDLRYALTKANASVGALDTITFDSSIDGSTIQLGSGLSITDAVVITGNGPTKTIVKGGGFGMLTVNVTGSSNNAVPISGVQFTGGTSGNAITNVDENLSLTNVSVTGNTGASAIILSGAAAKLAISKSTISNNNAGSTAGAAIRIDPNATTNEVTISDSVVSGNKTSGSGGGMYFNWGGSATITGSTFSDNSSGSSGGAIAAWNGLVTITNSTLYKNTASTGGGVALQSTGAAVTLNNSTVAGNTGTTNGGGIARSSSAAGDITLNSTIVATNVGPTPDLYASVAYSSLGDYSLVGVADVGNVSVGGANSQTGTVLVPLNPGFGDFGNYGGLTNTLPLSKGSPALDKGSNTFGAGSLDQRGTGFNRTVDEAGVGNADDGTDIGAHEGIGPNPTAVLTTSPGTITTAAATPNTLVVTYYDDVAIKVAGIGLSDITITGAKVGALTITGASPSPNTDKDEIAVTYTFTVPGGSWDYLDNDVYTVAMVGSEVGDGTTDVKAGTLGKFQVAIAHNFVVDATNDESVDSDSKTSLREALIGANNSAATNDTITFDNSVFTADTTITLGGTELSITDLVSINNTTGKKITVNANALSRVLNVNIAGANNAVAISNMAFTGGKTTSTGGGINMTDDSLTLTNVSVTGNSAGSSGGGVAMTTGKLIASGSTFSSNTTNSAGGGIFASSSSVTLVDLTEVTVNGNTAATSGGGVSIGLGTLNVTRSTISRNRANGTTTTGGGGISIGSGTVGTTFNLTNSTVSDNNAASGTGGGIRVLSAPIMTTISSTIVGNKAAVNGGGVSFNADNTSGISFQSSIVADNVAAATADQDFYVPSINLVLLNGNYNLYGVGDSPSAPPQGPNDIYGTTGTPISAKLAPLGFYGGPTETRPLSKGSPALDAGFNYSALSTDQRGTGFNRTIDDVPANANDGTDIGAVEGLTPIPIASLKTALQNVPPAGTPYTFDVVYDDDLGIDTTTIDATDVSVARPGGGFISGISTTTINASNPQSVTVTYSFPAPGGSWDVTENGSYTVSVNAGAVSDIDVPVHSTGATSLGSFNVALISTITVDSTADGIDFDYGPNKLTLREAVALANATAGGGQTIAFDATVFGSMQTITLAGSGLAISQPVIINGPTALVTVSGGGSVLPFDVSNGTTTTINVSISNMVITQGKSTTGGGIRLAGEDLTLTRVWLNANTASSGSGGGVLMVGISTLTLNSSAVTNNSASSGGGVQFVPGSKLVVSNSTMSGNTVSGTGGAISGTSTTSGSIQIRNSTLTNNKSGGAGGAIRVTNASYSAGLVDIVSTILSGNTSSAAGNADIYGYNLISTNSIVGGTNTLPIVDNGGTNKGGNAMLLPLANNGGVIPTHAISSPASDAFDKGSNPDFLTLDQRGTGNPRLLDDPGVGNGSGDGTDMGAYELDNTKPYVSSTVIANVPPTTTPYEFDISFADNVGINGSTIGTGDIEVVGPNGAKYVPTLKSPVGNGSPVTSTWVLTPPGGTWDVLDNGTYTVNIVGTIQDLDGVPQSVPLGSAGSFTVGIVGNLVVDNTGDAVDFDYSSNKLTFREALALTALMGAANTISFDPTVFASAQTITMTGGTYGLVTPVTISGPTAGVTFDAGGTKSAFSVNVPSSSLNPVAMSNLTIANGNGTTGAAIALEDEDLSLTGVTITGSTGGPAVYMNGIDAKLTATSTTFSNNNSGATGGGAIRSQPNANNQVITLVDSTLTGNTTTGAGGGIYFNWNGTLNAERTTFSNNSAGSEGGAIASWSGTGTIKNSSFGFNAAGTNGGAIALQSSSGMLIYNSTIGKNSATTGGGLYADTGTAGFTIDSVIVSQNTGGDISSGVALIADYSVVSDSVVAGTANKTGSAGLTTLANNGGPTQTFAITNASNAYNAGRNTLGLTTDQRGQGRKAGPQEDIGAFELALPAPPTATVKIDSGTGQRSMIQSITVTFSEAVNVGANPFSVTRLKTSFNPNQAPYVGLDAPVILSVAPAGPSNTFTITFNDPTYAPLNGSAKSLIDGLYSVSLNASDITSAANGQQLDGNGDLTAGDSQLTNFHRLYGDVRGASTVDLNGNGFTDNVDLIAFRNANGSDSTQINYDPALDSNADGFIDNIDLIAFRARLGQIP